MDHQQLVLLLVPIVVVDLAMKVWALVSATRAPRVRWGSKTLWVLVILLVNGFGWMAWFLLGPVDEETR